MNICTCEFIIIYYIIIDSFTHGVVYGYITLIVCTTKADFHNLSWKACANWLTSHILTDFEMATN